MWRDILEVMLAFKNIRIYFLLICACVSVGVYFFIHQTITSEQTQIIRIEQIYALTALFSLYSVLITTSLSSQFEKLQVHNLERNLQRGCIMSAFYFGLLHGLLAFFGQLGGFEGLGFLSGRYLLAVILSSTSLLFLCFLTLTTIDWLRSRILFLKPNVINFSLYFIGVSILIHAVMLGTHFQDLSAIIPQILFMALVCFFILEAMRFDKFLTKKFSFPQFGISMIVVAGIIAGYVFYQLFSQNTLPSLSIHSQHIQLAKQAQQEVGFVNNSLPAIPGLKGDRTRRYTVDFDHPEKMQPNQPTELSFHIYDASSGNEVLLFDNIYEKLMHLIVVDQEFSYFTHIHPENKGSEFIITTQFPKNGTYHLYVDFQPLGAIEQQFAFTITVGPDEQEIPSVVKPSTNSTKIFGDYEVSIAYPKPLKASLVSIGQQEITFNIKDAKSKKPVKTLMPYLSSFGHLVMINQKTFDYLHVHPSNLIPPKPNDVSGPDVMFLPLGLYGPVKPGTYRVFAQFNPDGKLFTADFVVDIQ